MSARILSMVSATLRFSWSDHETACRRFPADVMYIGSWTRRFRQSGDTPSTARCAVGHGGLELDVVELWRTGTSVTGESKVGADIPPGEHLTVQKTGGDGSGLPTAPP